MDDDVIAADYRVIGEEQGSLIGTIFQIAWSIAVLSLIKWAVLSVIGR